MAGAQARRYRAFISYSHKDKAAGDRLFKRLDGYRPPKALRGRETPFGQVPAKLYPVFRDREELASSPALAGRLEAALDASDHLVVICSPHAAASRWVNEEIRIFQRTGRENRIHAVLVDGEPAAALPPALSEEDGGEPLATDLRKEGDGWTDGPLKVIAGILGLGFGELKDREVARARARTRLFAAIAGVFALLTVIAGISAWRAVQQTREAEAQLSRAEAAILTAVEGVARIVEEVAAGSESGAIPTTLAKSLLMTADGMITGVVALAPDNPRLLEEQGKVLILFARHYQAVGDVKAAKAAAARARDLYAQLEARPGSAVGAGRLRSIALDEHGNDPHGRRRPRRRAEGLRGKPGDRRRLAAADPGNAGWARDVSVSLEQRRRRAGGRRRPRRRAEGLRGKPGDRAGAWPPPTPATPAGRATSRSA